MHIYLILSPDLRLRVVNLRIVVLAILNLGRWLVCCCLHQFLLKGRQLVSVVLVDVVVVWFRLRLVNLDAALPLLYFLCWLLSLLDLIIVILRRLLIVVLELR